MPARAAARTEPSRIGRPVPRDRADAGAGAIPAAPRTTRSARRRPGRRSPGSRPAQLESGAAHEAGHGQRRERSAPARRPVAAASAGTARKGRGRPSDAPCPSRSVRRAACVATMLAVAQHRHSVGDGRDLGQAVGDVEHGGATIAQPVDAAEQRRASTGVSTAVGSSRMTTRCGESRARAICTICRSAIRSRATGVSGSTAHPRPARRAAAALRMSARSRNGPRRRSGPRNMFSATVSWVASKLLLGTSTMPCRSASAGCGEPDRSAVERMRPVAGRLRTGEQLH